MSDLVKLKKKLQNALKLSGFTVRQEFCALIVDKFLQEDIDLYDNIVFESFIKKLSTTLSQQCVSNQSIEQEHIERVINICLHFGYDQHESVFNVIGAFDFPKLSYDLDRKLHFFSASKPKLLSDPNTKAQLFNDRYKTILQRTKHNFKLHSSDDKLSLCTVDYLLTLTNALLEKTLVLGALLQVSEGKFYLEDPTGMVQLDLSHAKYHGGFFVENVFVLVNGYYADRILQASTILLPPGEEYEKSILSFGSLNYFGGDSSSPLRNSERLKDHMRQNPHDTILFFSNLWFDYPQIFEKLEFLFDGLNSSPPVAFVFMGTFILNTQGPERMDFLKRAFKQFGELISHYPALIENSRFVFIPSMTDPATPHLVPRMPLPSYVTEEFLKYVPKAIFTTNPSRIQYCTREIVIFRADILVKLMQGTLYKPKKEEISEAVARTIISQGHLSPLPLNALTVHWDFDYALRLYPLPNLIVIGDKSEPYQIKYKGCQVANPGPFCEGGFQFKCYTPFTDSLDDCVL